MIPKKTYVSTNVANTIGKGLGNQGSFQSFSGTDITAMIYLPLLTKNTSLGKSTSKTKILAELQTISISSTRSISPVRVLGRSSPVAYTRGATTFAGTLVFASVNQDVFRDIYDEDIASATFLSSTSLTSDQLPPFSIVITAANEKGAAAIQIIHGVTLVNYGTTYSIDDLYTEVTYSYVATDVIPLYSFKDQMDKDISLKYFSAGLVNLSKKIKEEMGRAYGSVEDKIRSIAKSKLSSMRPEGTGYNNPFGGNYNPQIISVPEPTNIISNSLDQREGLLPGETSPGLFYQDYRRGMWDLPDFQ